MSTVTVTLDLASVSTSSGTSLAAIRAEAMDLIDEPVNPTTGKFSLDWWARRINRAKDVLAQETGFNMGFHSLSVPISTLYTALPTTLCWGILGVQWNEVALTPMEDSAETIIDRLTFVLNTTISASITTALIVNNPVDSIPTAGTLSIGTERIDYTDFDIATGGATGTFSGMTRAADNTTAAVHSAGVAVDPWEADTPTEYSIIHPNIYWNAAPGVAGPARILAGMLPADLTQDTDTITGLPNHFSWVPANGAAAIAEGIDLYDKVQAGRGAAYSQAFWRGVGAITAYMDDIDKRRNGAIQVISSHEEADEETW